MELTEVKVEPIGIVRSPRVEADDDNWGEVISSIEITTLPAEALAGLDAFSHIEVLFYMHRVDEGKIQTGARHPRNRTDWPKVGILAQRAKGRPNRLGLSRCQLVRVEGTTLTVRGLDAIDQTPVLDIKPYMVEFAPRGEVKQPAWATELMERYYE